MTAPLDDGDRQCLARALMLYIIETRDDIREYEEEPADADDAIDLARRLGVLDLVREDYTEHLLRRDEEEREERDALERLTRRLAATEPA